ncbi:MAG TPA: PAS domain-containing sensor histidine kinase [Gaiellaceae bacterium]|nr:PAS domain-containing sensor histidine kinase [Gaiellaceae bacterium]
MTSQLDGPGERFDELRARLTELAGDDALLEEMVTAVQQAVAHEAEVLNAILDQLPVGVTLLDPSYRVRLFNRRAREITGRLVATATPLVEWPVQLFHADGTPMAFEERPAVRALRGESSRGVVYEARDPDRPPYFIDASSTPVRDAAGEVILAVSVFEDVTEGRQREQADRDFVANAAHQIRSPIVAMASALGALSAGAKSDPEARERFLGHIEREVARMQGLADALLTLARAERGDQPAPLSSIALRPLLQRVIDRSAPKNGIAIELSCPEHLTALTNEALMSEALANVVTNAVQHTQRGTIALRAARGPDGPSIEVADEGPGIAAEDRKRIFERFVRGSPPAGPGVGLGLPIAVAAAHAAGGLLELVDSPAGACFRFTFRQTELAG